MINSNIDKNDLQSYINENKKELKELLIALCKIPAPSHFEHKRAEFCEKWFKENCTDNVYTDDALNVVCQYGNSDSNKTIVFMAHMDTVFPDTEPMPIREEDGKLYCPGAGDDTANLAILMLCAKYIFIAAPKTNYRILFVANSCEEGLGNLKGCREIMRRYGNSTQLLISFDLDTDTLINKAVGSHRYLIKTQTEGGHSYADFGNENAIRIASVIISELYEQILPKGFEKHITYNVGTINGGTSVNTIAQSCEFTYEYRSDQNHCLGLMKQKLDETIKKYQNNGYDVQLELIGERPGMSELKSTEKAEALTVLIEKIYLDLIGNVPKRASGSTDCNIPLSMGIPALGLGLIKMKGAHTRSEFVELDSLPKGLELAATIVNSIIDKF